MAEGAADESPGAASVAIAAIERTAGAVRRANFTASTVADGRVERAKVRAEMLECDAAERDSHANPQARAALLKRYIALCDPEIQAFYTQEQLPSGVRWLGKSEIERVPGLFEGGHEPFTSLRFS